MATTRINKVNLDKAHDKTDWKRLERQTERDIEEAARSDKTAPLLSDHQLNCFKQRRFMNHKLGL